ncbi:MULTISPECIES: heavy-metal-associated domain-containing protein [Echinicola]|uniref:Copper chaperone n=3 Tax=Echinicola TaxID=390846 RepID=L0G729_ECHVK|nr:MULTISPECIES: heavy-metal-associated domain-containing protein [Echinicola]AGA80660.1 copper chaperone [Echinicola vietnamensis DSM 17526]AWW29476.1 copper chaperone [Echinicola strongylocentroti]GGF43939.1 hypothetical protein GCM10011339_35550 [Echinicola rosea]
MKTIILSLAFVFLLAGHGIVQSTDSQKTEKASTTQENETVKLKVTELTCAGCTNHLYKILKETKGVIDKSVEYPGDIAVVEYDPKQTNPEKLIASIKEKTAYKAELYTGKND